jgi:hypothetical protein
MRSHIFLDEEKKEKKTTLRYKNQSDDADFEATVAVEAAARQR